MSELDMGIPTKAQIAADKAERRRLSKVTEEMDHHMIRAMRLMLDEYDFTDAMVMSYVYRMLPILHSWPYPNFGEAKGQNGPDTFQHYREAKQRAELGVETTAALWRPGWRPGDPLDGERS